ncbi:hypothetical protein [Streptomyces yangpuensis]|uniref:hypothetical protein n=1 Tax=Streptomyces yangpuensis TaxID=1648182 RepID=UPI0038120840
MNLMSLGTRAGAQRGRSRRPITSGVLLLTITVLASLIGQSRTAGAATAPDLAGVAAVRTSAAPGAPAGPRAAAKEDPKADHDAAVRALAQSRPAGACPAALEPRVVVSCAVDPYKTISFSITLPQQRDLLQLQVLSTKGRSHTKVVAPDGTDVTCEDVIGSGNPYGASRCATSQAGTYRLEVRDGSGQENGISVSYLPLLSSTACKAVGPGDHRLGAPTVFHGSLELGSAGDCYGLELVANDVLRMHAPPSDVLLTVYDGLGKEVCTSRHSSSDGPDCALKGTAPFRVMAQRYSGQAQTYDLTLARLNRPEGCEAVDPQAFGAAPDSGSTARCRTLRVREAAGYAFGPVTTGTPVYGGMFTTEGRELVAGCVQGACELTPGDYTWAVRPEHTDAGAFGMTFFSDKETRGCAATHDNGLVAGPATGTFGGPGQRFCLTLPTAKGNGVHLLNQPPTDGVSAAVTVYDAAGVKQCEHNGYPYYVCKLTGTAPFRAVLSSTESKPYRLVIHRTGETAGCAAWPQTGFDGTWGAEVTLSGEARQSCLRLPADKHSTAELVDHTNLQNRLNGAVHIVDPEGTTACSTSGTTTTTCRLTAGVPYTAMVVFTGYGSNTYKLARRDISVTAKCDAPASTAVGGQSLSFDMTSDLDARCVRVAGAATDRFWFGSRSAEDPRYGPSTTLMAVDTNGRVACHQWTVVCQATGSTSYVVIVIASGYGDKPTPSSLDTWKVATESGWVPECTANRLSVDGFPVRSGVLTESSSAYCAVVDVKPGQAFGIHGTSSATGHWKPDMRLLSRTDWDNSYLGYQCNGGWGTFGVSCSVGNDATAGQAALMLSAARASTPVEYSIQGVCLNNCTRPPHENPTGISPATGAAGTQTRAVISGTGLHLGTKVRLTRSGVSLQPVMKPVSVSADGTALTVLVDTNGLEPGTYDVVLDGIGYETGVPSPGYLPGAYRVTAAAAAVKSRFVPIAPSRFLDTRDGTGAAKARVGPGGVVTLQVAGVKGVPATGVTAVVMNVTAVGPTEAGHVMVHPNGQPRPAVSNLNFSAGQTVPNLVTVPVTNGKVDLRNNAGSVDLIADVTGYYTDKAGIGSALTPITPSRFLDTRDGTGAAKARVGPGGVVTLQVAGVKGIPASGVSAVVMNVTAVGPTEPGHVTVYPNGQAAPGVSNLNFTAGQIVPNLVTVPVVNGKVDLRNNAGSVDLIADVTGYYSATGSTFSAGAPVRLLDTREGLGARPGRVGPGGLVSLNVAGVEGVPLTGVTAVVLNVTVTHPTQPGHLIVYPHGAGRPNVSNLNFTAGQTVSNLVVVPVVDGRVTFFNNSGDVDVIADLNGYFTS